MYKLTSLLEQEQEQQQKPLFSILQGPAVPVPIWKVAAQPREFG